MFSWWQPWLRDKEMTAIDYLYQIMSMYHTDIHKHLQLNILYVKYLYCAHHCWKYITCCISTQPPPTDLIRQGKCLRFTINISKQLHHLCKNFVWNMVRRDKEASNSGGQERLVTIENYWKTFDVMSIVCWFCWLFNYDAKFPQFLGVMVISQNS